MDYHSNTGAGAAAANPAEAQRLLGIAEKLLTTRDLSGAREFALLAQETDPLLEGSDHILAIADVLSAAERRVSNTPDWYSILQVEQRALAHDPDLIKKNYRRLALVLHPDKNKFPFAESAFKLVSDAWGVLSDPGKRANFERDLGHLFARVDLGSKGGQTHAKKARDFDDRITSNGFWTACPYCYVLYEYPKAYEECCLRCPNCERAFHATPVPRLPPRVPGKEAYYCCWGFFPLGFSLSGSGNAGDGNNPSSNPNSGFPNWMPPMFSMPVAGAAARNAPTATPGPQEERREKRENVVYGSGGSSGQGGLRQSGSTGKKRGRPKKYPQQV